MDPDERIDALMEEVESRSNQLLARLSRVERDLDNKIDDVERAIERVDRRMRDLESRAR